MTGTHILTHDGPARLAAVGAFDQDNHHEIVEAVHRAIIGGHLRVTIDFREVTFIDAGTVRVLVSCRTLATAYGGDLRVINATGLPAFVLEATGAWPALCQAP